MATTQKTAKQLERHMKGVANHRRIDILFLIAKQDDITLEEIAEHLNCNMKTVSEHAATRPSRTRGQKIPGKDCPTHPFALRQNLPPIPHNILTFLRM